MCLIVNRNKLNFSIAKNDITVYKIVERKYKDTISKVPLRNIVVSFHRGYHYIKGVKQEHIDIIMENTINYNNNDDDVHFQIYKGYHYYTNLEYTIKFHETTNTICAAEFIIPKGTRYYNKKESNLGVAESIIFKKLLSTKQLQELLYRQ